jgi:hypothetical protein
MTLDEGVKNEGEKKCTVRCTSLAARCVLAGAARSARLWRRCHRVPLQASATHGPGWQGTEYTARWKGGIIPLHERPPTGGSHGKPHRTTKILSHARQRGNNVAARSARAARRARAADWSADGDRRKRSRSKILGFGVHTVPQAIGASGLGSIHHASALPAKCLDLRASMAPVDNSNSGHNQRRSVAVPHAPAYCSRSSAAMACPSGRVGEQLERHVDKHRFPMRIRPGDRPPVQRSANRPLMWNCCRQLEGRSGNWAALRLSGKPWIYCCQINVSGRSFRQALRSRFALSPRGKRCPRSTHRSQAAQLIQLRYLT